MGARAGERVAGIKVCAYWISRLPDSNADHSVWSVKVEAAGHGRWAVRNMGRCLNKAGTWEHEPQPSSREDDFVTWNGLTPADVLVRQSGSRPDREPSDGH